MDLCNTFNCVIMSYKVNKRNNNMYDTNRVSQSVWVGGCWGQILLGGLLNQVMFQWLAPPCLSLWKDNMDQMQKQCVRNWVYIVIGCIEKQKLLTLNRDIWYVRFTYSCFILFQRKIKVFKIFQKASFKASKSMLTCAWHVIWVLL